MTSWKGVKCDYIGPFEFPCFNPKSYRDLPSPQKPSEIIISICASTWRRKMDLIITSIESIYNQPFPTENYEVILVDDATAGVEKQDLIDAINYLLHEYPNHNFRTYFLNYTRCWNDAHTLNVAFKRALGQIIMQSQTDLLHQGETLESAWRHHNHLPNLRLCPAHYGIMEDNITVIEKSPLYPHEFGASYIKECVWKIKGRNETIISAPPDVDFQGAMRNICRLVSIEDPDVKTFHRKNSHPVSKGPGGKREGIPRYYDGDKRDPEIWTWTEGDWGVLTPEEESKTVMTEAMKKVL